MSSPRLLLPFLALLTFSTACVGEAPPAVPAEERLGEDPIPEPEVDTPTPEAIESFAGRYEIHSRFDLTQSGLIPDMASETLRSLANLHDNPSGTMFDIVEQANVPIAATVINLTPGFLVDIIENLINTYVFESLFEAVPVTEKITLIVEDLARVFTEFELVSVVEIGAPDEFGNTTLRHSLAGIIFRLGGEEFTVRAPELLAEVTANTDIDANVAVLYETEAKLEDGRLYLADHNFNLPVGELAVAGINYALRATMDVDNLRGALDSFISCPAIGQVVTDFCPGSTCESLGNAIDSLCGIALDLVVSQVEGSLTSISLDLVQFSAGEAAMYDLRSEQGPEDSDERMDRIERGHWSVQFGEGEDAVVIPGVFDGFRISDDPAYDSGDPRPSNQLMAPY